MVILRKALDHNLVTEVAYRESYSEVVEQTSQATSAGVAGGNFYYTLAARNGEAFMKAVIASAADGALMSSEAADLLGVNVKTLATVANHFFRSSLNLG